jgi:hypothetical protein
MLKYIALLTTVYLVAVVYTNKIMVDVTGINRDDLLKALWENSKPASFFSFNPVAAPKFDLDDAKRSTQSGGYVDYACGRCIKAAIYGNSDTIDPFGYDREYGSGSFQKIVDKLKSK